MKITPSQYYTLFCTRIRTQKHEKIPSRSIFLGINIVCIGFKIMTQAFNQKPYFFLEITLPKFHLVWKDPI